MSPSGPKLNQQICEEASDWLVRHRKGSLDATDKKAFDTWLRRSPEHIRAYLEISAVWEDLAAIDPLSCASADELIERATSDDPIVLMPETPAFADVRKFRSGGPSAGSVIGGRRWRRYPFRFASIAAACAAAAIVSWWVHEPSYSTGIAEQRSIRLADGSMIELNARSSVRVHFIKRERDIELVRGQALFHVAKDPQRPFIVRAGNTSIRAVGTQFDVNELDAGTVVTVVEGLVAVLGAPVPLGGPLGRDATKLHAKVVAELTHGLHGVMQPIFLSSGEQLTVTTSQQDATHVNVATATAWTRHQFAFDAAPLSEVVDEFNRYNARQLVIADPQLDDMRINGYFSSADPSLLLQFLRNQPEISVEDVGDEIRISKR